MTTNEFNDKYRTYLEIGHYGLDISDKGFIDWLDNKFQEFIKNPNFMYSQIKEKFRNGRFYCTGISNEEKYEVEEKITNLKD